MSDPRWVFAGSAGAGILAALEVCADDNNGNSDEYHAEIQQRFEQGGGPVASAQRFRAVMREKLSV